MDIDKNIEELQMPRTFRLNKPGGGKGLGKAMTALEHGTMPVAPSIDDLIPIALFVKIHIPALDRPPIGG